MENGCQDFDRSSRIEVLTEHDLAILRFFYSLRENRKADNNLI